MNIKKIACALAGLMLTSVSGANALEVRFYPSGQIYAYQLDAQRGANSLIIHNIAIYNNNADTVALNEVALELMSGGRVIETRVLAAPELQNAAAGGAGLQQAGLLDVLRFQFGGEKLLPKDAVLSPDLTLDPGEAVIVTSQVFSFRGARDVLRVRANNVSAAGEIAVSMEQSKTAFAFPLRGAWYVGAGSSFHTGHRWSPMEEFALDLVKLAPDQRTFRGRGMRFADYYAYGEAVSAAAPGTVVLAINDEAEDPSAMKRADEPEDAYFQRLQQDQFTRIARGGRGIGGNQVVIDHGNGEYSFYAHLKPGSVRVMEGDHVDEGAVIGAVGSSGNSTEPHLHFQTCNGADPLLCAGIPAQWKDLKILTPDLPRAPQTGDLVAKSTAR